MSLSMATGMHFFGSIPTILIIFSSIFYASTPFVGGREFFRPVPNQGIRPQGVIVRVEIRIGLM